MKHGGGCGDASTKWQLPRGAPSGTTKSRLSKKAGCEITTGDVVFKTTPSERHVTRGKRELISQT